MHRKSHGRRDKESTHPGGLTDPYIAADAYNMQPLLQFRIARSFAHQSERAPRITAITDGDGNGDEAERNTRQQAYDQAAAAVSAPDDGTSQPGSIMSFKEVSLQLGPVDFTAQESFLNAAFSFFVQLPMQDVWQVRCPLLCLFTTGQNFVLTRLKVAEAHLC